MKKVKFITAQTRISESGGILTREKDGVVERWRIDFEGYRVRLICPCCGIVRKYPAIKEQKEKVWGVSDE